MIYTLLSTARSGSTWYGEVMVQRYGGNFLGEVFHNEIDLQTQKKNFINVMREYSEPNKNCVIKVFPNHIMDPNIVNLQQNIFDASADVEILVRRNFNDQLKSLYVANEYEALKNPLHDINVPATWQDNFDTPLTINRIDTNKLDFMADRLKKELLYLSKLYHKYHFKVSYLEDIKDQYTQYNIIRSKLHRPVIWNAELPVIDFDTESLF